MTREEFIGWCEERFALTKNDIYEFGQLYDEVTKPRWISVDDELPPLNQDVLVCSVINQDNAVAIDRIIQNIEDNGYADWELYTDITHWMPLPSIEHLRETNENERENCRDQD